MSCVEISGDEMVCLTAGRIRCRLTSTPPLLLVLLPPPLVVVKLLPKLLEMLPMLLSSSFTDTFGHKILKQELTFLLSIYRVFTVH